MAVEAGPMMMMVVDDLVPLLVLLVVLAPRPALCGRAQHGVRGHGRVPREAASPRPHQGALVGRLHCHDQVAGVGNHHVGHLRRGQLNFKRDCKQQNFMKIGAAAFVS